MIIKSILTCALAASIQITASAQTAPTPAPTKPSTSDWQRVQALPAGASIYVYTKTAHKHCNLKSDDADSITCTSNAKDLVFQRTEVKTIKLSRRGRSALIASIPGAALAAGGGIGLAVQQGCKDFLCGLGSAAIMVLGIGVIIISAPIGAATDFKRLTIYNAAP